MSFDLDLYRSMTDELPMDDIADVLVSHGAVVTAEDAITFFLDEEAGLADAQVYAHDFADEAEYLEYPAFELEGGEVIQFTGLSATLTFDPSERSAPKLFVALEELQERFDIWLADPQSDSEVLEQVSAEELLVRYNASAERARAALAEDIDLRS